MKLKKSYTAVLLLLAALFMTSCNVIDEFNRLGFRNWLEYSVGGEVAYPTSTPETSVTDIPTITPTVSETNQPPIVFPTVPVPPEYPSISSLVEALTGEKPGNADSMIVSVVGEPDSVKNEYKDIWSTAHSLTADKYSSHIIFNNISIAEADKGLLSAMSGEYFTDALLMPYSLAEYYYEKGYLADIDRSSLSSDPLSYYGIENISESFFLAPSSLTAYESSVVIYANTELLEAFGITGLEELIKSGKWNIKEFADIIYKIYQTEGLSHAASIFSSEMTEKLLLAGIGDNGTDSVDIKAVTAAMSCGGGSGEELIKGFYEGSIPLIMANVSLIRELASSYDSYSLFPMPKGDKTEGSEHITVYDPERLYVFVLPKTGINNAESLFFIDQTAKVSRYEFRYTYLQSLYEKYLRNPESAAYTSVAKNSGVTVSRN